MTIMERDSAGVAALEELGIWDINLNTRDLNLCDRSKEIFGISDVKSPYIKAALQKIGLPARRELINRLSASCISGSRFQQVISLNVKSSDMPKIVCIKGHIEFNDDCKAIRIVGVMADIGSKRELELKKADLLAMVSHELKAPLTTIKLYIQLAAKITKNKPAVAIAGYLESAVREVDNMTILMNNFLDFSAVETGNIKLFPELFDLTELVEEEVERWIQRVPGHLFSFDQVSPVQVCADRLKIKHVINNLLSNAVKYSAEMSKIQITCKKINGEAIISVRDQGEGISPDDQKKLFGRFSRVGNNHSGKISGHGMGLYLVKEFMHQHGGQVWIKSQAGEGSEFYVSLPIPDILLA